MLVVISNPTSVPNEAKIINALFGEGLAVLHLRKPDISTAALRILLEEIKPEYCTKITLHQQHGLADDFGIKRLHFTEIERKKKKKQELMDLKEQDYTLSTSIHEIKDYNMLPASFSYTFLGPVFNSISKAGYDSVLSDDFVFPVKKDQPKVYAIGGIDAGNIKKVKAMNFSGAAVLGTIWQKPEDSLKQFKILQAAWTHTGR